MRTMMCFYRSVRFVPDDELEELSSWKLASPQSEARDGEQRGTA